MANIKKKTFVQGFIDKIEREVRQQKREERARKREEKKDPALKIKIDEDYVNVENQARKKALPKITDEAWEAHEFENKKNKKYIDEWLKEVVYRSKSPATYKQYKSAIRQFAMWNEVENEGTSFHKLKKRAFLRYQNYLLELGMSKKGVEFKRNVVSSFCNFLEVYVSEEDERYESFRNFVKGTEAPSGAEKVYNKTPVTYDEFLLVKKWLLLHKRYMLHAVWTTLFYTGNRIAEVMQIRMSDIRDVPEELKFIKTGPIRGKGKGKDGKELEIRLTRECVEAIQLYIEKDRPDTDSFFVFYGRSWTGNDNEHITPDTIRQYFATVISPILNRRINPHLMRGSFATYLLEKGMQLDVVKELLNHESIETTNKFYDLRDKSAMADDAFENFEF